MSSPEWWQGAVIYQIYPRSFMDSNGDGVGDLRGIIDKLDYIESLGVDAVWVSPFFASPMCDFGYDISDYRAVEPLFGSLDDFDRLIEAAHSRNIKVIIDQVLSHTSDQHRWFIESRQNRDNAKADWYVWAEPASDGGPPNNWLSIFGGSAWEWDSCRRQYYLHNFLKSQPDLNFHNPSVRQQMLDEVEFWLKRGIDGVRLDAINFCYHDEKLRNNPPKPEDERKGRGFTEDNPYAYQYHIYDNTRPQMPEFLQALRSLLNRYPGAVSLGEISSEYSLATMAEYTAGNTRLHMAYSFELLVDTLSAKYIRSTVEDLEAGIGDGWPCWSIGNHDVRRVMSRWGVEDPPDALAKVLTAMLGCLRGSVCSYQGEELGLSEADIARHQVQDPYGLAFWPNFKGRDGCRTPQPWEPSDCGGFSVAKPWLPIPKQHRERAVTVQQCNTDSVLNAYRTFMHWRKDQPALRYGDIEFIDAPDDVLAFVRKADDQHMLVCLNLSAAATAMPVDQRWQLDLLDGHGFARVTVNNGQLLLPAYGAYFGEIRR